MQIKHLSITNKTGLHELASDLSFTLNDGDRAAIIGEEGNGKSTLLKLIYDASLVEDYIDYSGEILYDHSILGYLEQELGADDRRRSVYEYLLNEPLFIDCEQRELAMYAAKLQLPFELLYSDRQMGSLSGGERIKLSMIRILCRKPDVLLLDEPSNDLDLDTLKWLEELIAGWRGAVLYISHDETLLERTANKIIHLEQIRRKTKVRNTVIASGYREYVQMRALRMDRQEQRAASERREYRIQQEKFRRIRQKVEHQQEIITRQDPGTAAKLKKKMHAVKSQERRFEKEFEQMTEFPDMEDAIYTRFGNTEELPPRKPVLALALPELKIKDRILAKNVCLEVIGPQKIGIVGTNGCGKTTLLKQIAAQLLARSDIKASYLPQNYGDAEGFGAGACTPVEFLAKCGDKEEETRIRTYLGSLKFTAEEMDHPMCALSGGQKAKLLLLNLCMSGANVLILDEPTRNFSPLSGPVIRRILAGYPGAIISVSHDRKYISEVCDRIYYLTETGLRAREKSDDI